MLRTGLVLMAGMAMGALAVGTPGAQPNPPTYAVIDVASIGDPDGYRAIGPKGEPSIRPYGGRFVMRTDNIVASDGAPPKRYIVIAFDSLEKARAWRSSAGMNEIMAIQDKTSSSRVFFVEGLP
jgi:uncharacterized protein (DUF1330 family)